MNRLACLLVLIVTAMLAGCSVAIIHPPSAATFMEKREDSFVKDFSVSAIWGDLALVGEHVADNIKKLEHSKEWYDKYQDTLTDEEKKYLKDNIRLKPQKKTTIRIHLPTHCK